MKVNDTLKELRALSDEELNTKIKESWEHTRNVIDVPESCYLKISDWRTSSRSSSCILR